METLQWCGAGRLLRYWPQAGRKEIGSKEEEEVRKVGQVMVSTISFIQANLQHIIAASGILTRTVGARGIDLALRNCGIAMAVSVAWVFQDIPCTL